MNGLPIFRDDVQPIAIMPTGHESNALGTEFEALLARGREFVLHLGAGSTARKYPNCIELEQKAFCHTDLVGQSTLKDWADFWSERAKAPAVFQVLQSLPNEFQSRIAAGFEFVARKP